jgi:glycine C-acetyltransferase
MNQELDTFVRNEIKSLKDQKMFKAQRRLQSQQGPRAILDERNVVMLCTNNYLGLASHPKIKEAAINTIKQYGCGTASVSEVCGLTNLHDELCHRIAAFSKTEAALLYPSCSTANIGVVGCLMDEGDVIFSDQFNHASIIDGCRFSKAKTVVFPHNDMDKLEAGLKEAANARLRMIVVDGIFSMEGDTAPLDKVVELANKYSAITVVDESHAVGVLGKHGAGTVEQYGVQGKVDILTGTFGKALGGAGGGYVCGSQALVDYLFHRSRTFIFTNALPPVIVATALAALSVLNEDRSVLNKLWDNTHYFRMKLEKTGLKLLGGGSPIIPIMVGEAEKAYKMTNTLLDEGVFIIAVGFPIVPKGEARLRAQVSAAHSLEDLDYCVNVIEKVAKKLEII